MEVVMKVLLKSYLIMQSVTNLLRPWLSKKRDSSGIERHKSMAALTDANVRTAGGRELRDVSIS
jgi:hypothetical protein